MRAFVLFFAAAIASPALAADAERGRELALRWCAECHVVAPDAAGGDAGPSFVGLAADPERSDDDLRVWLADPHPPMTDFNLSSREIDDIVAHIRSLADCEAETATC